MTQLTDTQCVLLSTAAKRDSLSIYPLTRPASSPSGGLAKSDVTAYVGRCDLTEERETTDASEPSSRTDGDYRYGLYRHARRAWLRSGYRVRLASRASIHRTIEQMLPR